MTKDRKKSAAGRTDVDEDDQVWRHTVQSVEPLKRGKARVHKAMESEPKVQARPQPKNSLAKHESAGKPKPQPQPPSPPRRPAAPPPLADFDRKAARRIRRGSHEIEARLDLHGMRQDEAHAALRAFVQRCAAGRKRWVLVITGKGKPASADDAGSLHDRRGILRRNVPRWLEEPDLRVYVVSFTEASIGHGGEGALYIHLRTRDAR